MASNINQYGLSRTIPEPVKREVRQRCGHGCVFCGCMLITYEHIDPTFVDCKSHDPSKMCLLCNNCHRKVTNRLISKDKVKRALESPKAKEDGFINEFFTLEGYDPVIKIGSNTTVGAATTIDSFGYEFITAKRSTEQDGLILLNATFSDTTGSNTLKIVDNEWIANSEIWDVEFAGRTLTIKEANSIISLQLSIEQPSTIVIERLNMNINGNSYKIGVEGTLSISQTNKGTNFIIGGNRFSGDRDTPFIQIKSLKDDTNERKK